jgi:hypothetical protein
MEEVVGMCGGREVGRLEFPKKIWAQGLQGENQEPNSLKKLELQF